MTDADGLRSTIHAAATQGPVDLATHDRILLFPAGTDNETVSLIATMLESNTTSLVAVHSPNTDRVRIRYREQDWDTVYELIDQIRDYGILIDNISAELSNTPVEVNEQESSFEKRAKGLAFEGGLDEVLSELQEIQLAKNALEEQEQEVVSQARQHGATWKGIGEIVGITKQAAYKRYTAEGRASVARHNEAARQRRTKSQADDE